MATRPTTRALNVDADGSPHDELLRVETGTRRRCLNREDSARYLGTSVHTIDRLNFTGQLPVVKLPIERDVTGHGRIGTQRRKLFDIRDLDRLVDQNKEVYPLKKTLPLRRRA